MTTAAGPSDHKPVGRLAYCRLVLHGEHWMPIGVDTRLTTQHRVSADGPVVTAFLTALVKGDRLVGWPERQNKQPFSINNVLEDGTVEYLDETFTVGFYAMDKDKEAAQEGAIGINERLAERRIEELLRFMPQHVREAAFDRARLQILDKLHGKRAEGVLLGTHPIG